MREEREIIGEEEEDEVNEVLKLCRLFTNRKYPSKMHNKSHRCNFWWNLMPQWLHRKVLRDIKIKRVFGA